MAYLRKSIKGDENVQTEQLSHNRVNIQAGQAVTLLVVYLCILVTASIVLVSITHLDMVITLVVASFVGFFVCGWILALAFTIRAVSAAKTAVVVDEHNRSRAQNEANVIHATDGYILWRDTDGSIQFRGSTIITENRQFLPHQIAAPSHQETILELFDKGMSGRGIEKLLKEKKVSYREIVKTLDLYRPEWNKKGIVDSDLSAEE